MFEAAPIGPHIFCILLISFTFPSCRFLNGFLFYWFTFILALPRCESVRPNMPEIINLLKGFQMCEFRSEDRGLHSVCVRLTFNILTSYFKNEKLRKHVSLAGSGSPFYLSFSVAVARLLPPAHTLTHNCQNVNATYSHMCTNILQDFSLEIQQLGRNSGRGQWTIQRERQPQHFKVHTSHRSGKHGNSPPLSHYICIYIYVCICLAMSTVEAEVSSGQLSKSRILNNK